MLKPLIIGWRLLIILIIALVSALLSLTVFYLVPLKIWHKMIRIWSNLLIKASGVKLKVSEQSNYDYLVKNHMLVANHMSWLDILILVSIHVTSFVAKAEIAKWPVINQIAKAINTDIASSRPLDAARLLHLLIGIDQTLRELKK